MSEFTLALQLELIATCDTVRYYINIIPPHFQKWLEVYDRNVVFLLHFRRLTHLDQWCVVFQIVETSTQSPNSSSGIAVVEDPME